MTQTPAGWHRDQNDPTQERYWDGTAWTEQRRPVVAPTPTQQFAAIAPTASTGTPWYKKTWIVALIALFVGIGIGAAGASGSSSNGDKKPTAGQKADDAGDSSSDEPVVDEEPEPEPEPEPEAEVLARDFSIKIKVREQECFGSAGCNVIYQINPAYNGLADLSEGT